MSLIKKIYKLVSGGLNKKTNGNKTCPLCSSTFNKFLPLDDIFHKKFSDYGFIHSIYQFETLNIMEFRCPVCYSIDRERLIKLYMDMNYINSSYQVKILHFAPEKSLLKELSRNRNFNIKTADLLREDVDDNVDIQDLRIYEDCMFDLIICSHILEHVQDDTKAILELYRILTHGGKAIVLVPILLNLKMDYENENIVEESERWKHFGQNDHVRIYSKNGFLNKAKNANFKVNQLDIHVFGNQYYNKHGISQKSVLYEFIK